MICFFIKSISNNRKWTITPASGISAFDVGLIYTDPGFTIDNEDSVHIIRGTSGGSDWVDADDDPSVDTGNDEVTTINGLSVGPTVDYTVAEAQGSYTWDGGGGDRQDGGHRG